MNKANKTIWLKALRSGEYLQGHGSLCKPIGGIDYYCCLGVYAEECIPGDWVWDKNHKTWGITIDGNVGYIPNDLANRYGVSWNIQHTLSEMNDAGKPFPEIADWIEENL